MPKTLLLADDSVTIQKVVGISFANEDIELVTVDNGDDAVDRARELRPDIILADVVMPGKTGYQVCEAIKDDPALAHIPVLLLTGTFETFDENRAAQVRADGHITKPFEAQALVDQVNSRLAESGPTIEPEPEGLGLTGLETPGEAADQAYDLFEDEVTAPSGVSTSPATTTLMMDGDEQDAAAAQTWVEDFGADPAAAAQAGVDTHPGHSLDPVESAPAVSTPEPVLASGDPLDEPAPADALFDEAAPATGSALFEDSAPVASDSTTIFDDAPSAGEQTIFDQPPLGDSGISYSAISEPTSEAAAAAPAPDQTEAFLLDEELDDQNGDMGGQSLVGEAGDDLFDAPEDDGATRLLDTTMPPSSLLGDSAPSLEADSSPVAQSAAEPVSADSYDVSSSEISEPEVWSPAPASPVILPSEPDWPEAEATPADEGIALATPSPAETVAIFPDDPSEDSAHLAGEAMPLETAAVVEPELVQNDVPAALSPMMEKQLREGIEKLAWDAFGDLAEKIVKDAVDRIEQVAWEVIPKMAETLVREEIRKMKDEPGE